MIPVWRREGPAYMNSTDGSNANAEGYRRVIAGSAGGILLVAFALLAWVGPREYRRLNQRIKQATLGYTWLTIATCVLALAAAFNDLLAARWVNALLYSFVGVAQLIDGAITWERYQIIYPGYNPSLFTRLVVGFYIFWLLFLPFLMDWMLVAYKLDKHVFDTDTFHGTTRDIVILVCNLIYMCSVPARIVWDSGFGSALFLRINELRAEAKDEKRDALLSLSRKVLAYTVITTLLNLAIHVPATHLLPYEPIFCMGFHLTLATLTHLFFSSGGDAGKWVGWRGLLPSGLTLLQAEAAAVAAHRKVAAAPPTASVGSAVSVPDPFTSQHPRPPLPQTAAAEAQEAWPQPLQQQEGYHTRTRARPDSFVQSREGVSLFSPRGSAAAVVASPGMRQRRTPRSAGKTSSVNIEIVPSPVGVASSPRSGSGRMVTRAAASKKAAATIHHRIPREEADAEEGMERLGSYSG